ncbi:MAG: hypothetical protein JJ934_13520 [Pseudomonadales bacterium]|nr:hypothetical protein [Pseudomonadales bacterium]MBO6563839.1 hypothetical protein [Pseudomonadales bacterium]MBO6596987.1 hypothetical protein [Pseudomonadales bacterium]MBO6657914.1 hypothetical protein [Pseudomonadales bacterium]MBO6823827.1 hypothetical protein [Pseudomonadales bacterium]
MSGVIDKLESVKNCFEQTAVGDTLRITVIRDGDTVMLCAPKPDNRECLL